MGVNPHDVNNYNNSKTQWITSEKLSSKKQEFMGGFHLVQWDMYLDV